MSGRVLTLGESMGLIRTDGVGDFTDAGSAILDTGGSEGNVAVGLARYEVAVTWLGRVGDDSWGRRVVADLRGQGVEVQAIVDPDAPTGVMFKATPRAGSTSVHYYRAGSAGSRLNPADLQRVDMGSYDLLHVTGITPALSESAAETVHAAVAAARAAGLLVSFDVNFRSKLWSAERAAPVLRGIAALSDVLVAGEDEAALLVPDAATGADLLAALHELGPREVVIKKGANGASTSLGGDVVEVRAVPVQVVDTVGAGDAFTAVYLAETLAGSPVLTRLERAAVAGALACGHPGDWRGAATRAEVLGVGTGADPVRR